MAENERRPIFKKWWFWVLLVVLVIAIASMGGDDDEVVENENNQTNETDTAETEEAQQNEENETTEETDEPVQDNQENNDESTEEPAENETQNQEDNTSERVIINTGIHEVGTDIQPGLYRSEGDVNYWARLSGYSGELEDIIANGNPFGDSHLVEIAESDTAFETSGSGHWFLIDESYQPETVTEFGDGMYMVGVDIEPGKYKSTGGDSMGYWARLSGFSGDLEDIIANGNPEGPTIVEISESDKGFETSGSGTWKKVE